MDASQLESDLVNILFTEEQIHAKLEEMAAEIARDYEGHDLLMVGVLRGAVMVMADLSRALDRHVEMDWMAVSSYGSGTKSSGVVRILKDLESGGYSVPIGLGIGQVIPSSKTIFNLFIEPQVSVAEKGAGCPKWQVFVGLNTQFK